MTRLGRRAVESDPRGRDAVVDRNGDRVGGRRCGAPRESQCVKIRTDQELYDCGSQ